MAMKLYSDSSVQAIANAIRSKNGESTQYKIADMAQAILDIPSGGSDNLPALVMNTLTTLNDETITSIRADAFKSATALQSVDLPNATTLNTTAFNGCTNLRRVYLPKVKNIQTYCFQNCTKLVDYDFSNVTTINATAFNGCTSLVNVYAPKCTQMGVFGGDHFKGCTSLIQARFPNLGDNMPDSASLIRSTVFANDTALKLVDLGVIKTLGSAGACFGGCTGLEILILRRTASVTAVRSNEFGSITAGSPVTVYVPSALKASYETATNWSTYLANNKVVFADLEGSPYEATDFVYNGVPASD